MANNESPLFPDLLEKYRKAIKAIEAAKLKNPEKPIHKLCVEYGIGAGTFYKYRQIFAENSPKINPIPNYKRMPPVKNAPPEPASKSKPSALETGKLYMLVGTPEQIKELLK